MAIVFLFDLQISDICSATIVHLSAVSSDQDALRGHQQPSKHMPAQLSVMLQRVHWAGTRQNQKCWEAVGIMLEGNGSNSEDVGKISKGDDRKGLMKLNQLQVGYVFKFYFY